MIASLSRAYPGGRWRSHAVGEVVGYVAGRNVRVLRDGDGYTASLVWRTGAAPVTAVDPVEAVRALLGIRPPETP